MFWYHAVVFACLLWVLFCLAVNLTVFRSLRRVPPPTSGPRVSVLVPARNEENRLGPCLASLATQDYPDLEILILDDHSTDGTAKVALQHGVAPEDGPVGRLLSAEDLPPGWTGKAWACKQLADAASGDYLLFTDADTRHDPNVVSAAVAVAEKTGADLLSAWPRLMTHSWSEHLVIPLIHLLAVALYPHGPMALLRRFPSFARRIPKPWLRAMGAANGQFLLFRRDAYTAIGGHAAVKDHLVEDVALGRAVAERMGEGMRLVNWDGSTMSEVRMYARFAEVWEGFTKNLRAAFEGSLATFVCAGLFQVCCFLLPFFWLPFAGPQAPLVWGQVAAIYAIRALMAWRLRTSWIGCLLHPVGEALAIAIALNSWRRTGRAGVTWKGRTYTATSQGHA